MSRAMLSKLRRAWLSGDEATALRWYASAQELPQTQKPQMQQPQTLKSQTQKLQTQTKKLRILALHGYGQTPDGFRQKIGSLRSDRPIKRVTEFIFAQAPLQVHECDHSKSVGAGVTYGYWRSRGETASAQCLIAMKWLDELCERQGPFDGIFAFSQGAALASVYLRFLQKNKQTQQFRFACLFSGFEPTMIGGGFRVGGEQTVATAGLKLGSMAERNELISIASLHFWGLGDEIVPAQYSQQLADLFETKTIIEHTGGHFVPSGSEFKKHFREFILKQQLDQ